VDSDSTPSGHGGEHMVGVSRMSKLAKKRATIRPTAWIVVTDLA
jgi:hypothetical protein